MNRLKLILVGLIPLVAGTVFSQAVVKLDGLAPRAWLVALFFLTGWIVLGYISGTWGGGALYSTLWAHLPAALLLIAVAYQQVRGGWFDGVIRSISQTFFLPLISLANFLPVAWLHRTFLFGAGVSFVMMVLAFLWGARSRQNFEATRGDTR